MRADTSPGLTSIIVPCFNLRGFTELCFQALFRHTQPAWELIVVNNGSTDDTTAYLAGVRDAASVPITIIANAENLGFPRAINQGLQAASGAYFVLLNNDAVVTDGWLDQLIALTQVQPDGGAERPALNQAGLGGDPMPPEGGTPAESGESGGWSPGFSRPTDRRPAPSTIGLVGPMSNYAAPPQLVEDVPYRDLDQMHAFARRWRDEHRGTWFTAPKLSGFCVLMKRAVHESIGGLDERFGLGLFDDDDLAVRARRAGFELAVAHDLFVHHFGSRTFAGNGIDAEALLQENQQRFAAKWGDAMSRGRRVALQPWSRSQQPHTIVESGREEVGPQMNADPNTGSRIAGSRITDSRLQMQGEAVGPQIDAGSHSVDRPIVPSSHLRSSAFICGQDSSDRLQRRPTVSLTMIVKDEENNLPPCLQSVSGIFDEIVVVDTGSVDRTREIARSFGATVFDFPWIDDFATARNAALRG